MEDFGQTIHHVIEEASPSLAPQPDASGIQALIGRTTALIHRFKRSRELEDANSAIIHLRHLLDNLEVFNVPRYPVITSLSEMLAARVDLKDDAGDALEPEDTNEIMSFCSEVLASPNASPPCIADASQAMTGAVLRKYSYDGQVQPLGQAIECLRGALKTCLPGPDSLASLSVAVRHDVVSLNLANLLTVRFLTSYIDDDYEEAIQVLHAITSAKSSNSWGGKDSYHSRALSLTHALSIARSMLFSSSEDSAGVLSHCLSFISHSSDFGDPLHPLVIDLLKRHANDLSEHFGHGQGTIEAHSEVDQVRLSLSFTKLGLVEGGVGEHGIIHTAPSLVEVGERIRGLRQHLCTTPQGTDLRKDRLKDLVRWYNVKIHQTKDVGDIKEAIKCHQMLLDSVHPSDPSRFCYLSAFSNLLYLAYQQTNSPEYLHASIARHYEVLKSDSAKETHFVVIQRLIALLSIRFQSSGRKLEDLDEIMDQFKSGVTDTYATAPSRFELACRWAYSARISRHNSLRTAYHSAMSLIQDSLVFGPTLTIQHNRLTEKRDLYEKTPLNFASHQIRGDQVERAIETLEQGRALLWSEMRGLRTSTDRLRAERPALADKFTAINRELEMLTTSTSSSGNVGIDDWDVEPHGADGMLHPLMVKQAGLLKQRDGLISQIRSLPNFKDFLKPPSFDTLRSAATHGVVIIIAHCKWRSDIIIVLRNSRPSLIPTSYKFFARANQLKERLLTTRKVYGFKSERYADTLRSVLADLYELVGRPVIKRLKELRIPEHSRVWWCPTSVFGYLPLHAMGPIPSSGPSTQPKYFSDLFISSYTPTLSALIASRNSDASMPVRALPNILDAQPRPEARAETQVIQGLDLQVTSLAPENMTLTTLRYELSRHRLADIGYHCILKEGRPFDTSWWFHSREYLTILDVVGLRLPTCEFAFLPGSHTAELTEGSIPDEALHFAAAVQYSGVRSVIGSMWETVDGDGRNLAKDVYLSMFSGDDHQTPYHERSARALRDAVLKMRKRNVSLVRWVNFVHFGA